MFLSFCLEVDHSWDEALTEVPLPPGSYLSCIKTVVNRPPTYTLMPSYCPVIWHHC